jgi:hypothetical protein
MLQRLWDPSTLAIICATAVQFALFLRWLYRRIRNDELLHLFVADMATNHLPHIYEVLVRLCERQEIEPPPSPPIRWIDLNGKLK